MVVFLLVPNLNNTKSGHPQKRSTMLSMSVKKGCQPLFEGKRKPVTGLRTRKFAHSHHSPAKFAEET